MLNRTQNIWFVQEQSGVLWPYCKVILIIRLSWWQWLNTFFTDSVNIFSLWITALNSGLWKITKIICLFYLLNFKWQIIMKWKHSLNFQIKPHAMMAQNDWHLREYVMFLPSATIPRQHSVRYNFRPAGGAISSWVGLLWSEGLQQLSAVGRGQPHSALWWCIWEDGPHTAGEVSMASLLRNH